MKKILSVFLFLSCLIATVSAQTKTVVYLLPMNSENVTAANSTNIQSPKAADLLFSKSVIGFWCGSQIALKQLGNDGYNIKVIAREINGNDETKLNSIFNEPEVQSADLIIAPVSKDIFPAAADLAQQNKIPIVNPLSPNSSFISGKSAVFKMTACAEARPATLLKQFPDAHFIIWGKVGSSVYENYFTANNIPFTSIESSESFVSQLPEEKTNIVIACTETPNDFVRVASVLANRYKKPSFSWIIPEKILNDKNLDLKSLSPYSLYFMTDFFVDDSDEAVAAFQIIYEQNFHTLPTLQNYAYQGYDASMYFIKLIFNDFNVPQDFTPLSCHLKLARTANNGAENQSIRLVKLSHMKCEIIQ